MPDKLFGSNDRLIRISLVLLFVSSLIIVFARRTVIAQDGGQTYTTSDGLSFAYPDGWGLYSSSTQIFLSTSENAQSRSDLAANDVYAIVMSEQNLAQLFGQFDDLQTAAQTVSSVFTAGARGLNSIALTINDHAAIRYDFEDEHAHSILVFLDINGKIIAVIASAPLADFATHEPTLLAIINSMQYETAEGPDTEATATLPPTVGDVEIVWQRQYEIKDNIFVELGRLNMMASNGDSIFLSDIANIVQLDGEGNIVDFRYSDGANYFTAIAGDLDDTVWAGSFGEDAFLHLDQDNNILAGWNNADFPNPVFGSTIGIDDIALGPDGNFYVFSVQFDDEFNGESHISVWNNAGELLYDFIVSEIDDTGYHRFVYNTYISFTPDGNLFLAELGGFAKIVDTEGNVVKNDFEQGFGQYYLSIADAVVGLDGSIYIADYQGIHRLSADGSWIEDFGTPQDYEPEPPPFATGEFSVLGPTALALMSNGDIIAIDANETYNLVVRLNFDDGFD